jgi:hypothetical protein
MSSQTFGMIEIVGYATAVVLAAATLAYFFVHHIREVRGELTGATARAAIEEMRTDGVSRFAAGALASQGEGADVQDASTGGSLRVRFFGGGATGSTRIATGKAGDTGKTRPATGKTSSARKTGSVGHAMTTGAENPEPSEVGTTLLSPDSQIPSEIGTTLLSADPQGLSDIQTTLLTQSVNDKDAEPDDSDKPDAKGPASEAMTTLLGGESANASDE